MSDSPLVLPLRPSLEQLRKQAKDRLDTMPGAKLAEAQFALARDYGFDSWPKLARHVEALARPEVDQQERIARDLVAAYRDRDEAAAARLNDLFHSALDIERIRHFVTDRLCHVPGGEARLADFGVADARLLVARLYGFEDWDGLVSAVGAPDGSVGLASTPPFYRIDSVQGIIEPRQPMSPRDWDTLIAVMRERGLTGLRALNMMDDAAMAKLADVPHVKVLQAHGSNRLTDAGLRHLAALPELEELTVGGWHSPITDAGFAAIRGLPRLRVLHSMWSRHLTDAGIASALAPCPRLEDAHFMGTAAGDRLIESLAGKPDLWRLFAGQSVTDAGLSRLHDIPRFQRWTGGERKYSLLDFDARPTYLAITGPFTAAGLRSLAGLDGLFALNVHWKSAAVTSADLATLAPLGNLGFLAIDGDLCDDEAMRQIGRLPHLRMLLAQEPVAGDDGFVGLAQSRTLEYIWGRECPNLHGRGLEALASVPSMRGLAVSLKFVEDASLTALARMPNLTALMPMDVSDDGFRHVGRCERLEELWCMYCAATGDIATGHVEGLRLKTYYAGYTKITDRSLAILSRMATLERVELQGCHGVSDAGVRLLAALPGLRQLTIEASRNVTRAAFAAFAPQVRVSYSAI